MPHGKCADATGVLIRYALIVMDTSDATRPVTIQPTAPRRTLRWFGVLFALAFPTLIAWGYIVVAGQHSATAEQVTYVFAKTIQFAFPLVWVWLVLREPLRTGQPTARGLLLGGLFSVFVVASGWALFESVLRDTTIFASAAQTIHDRITRIGIDTVWKYAVLGGFYALIHSLLEEYYWRWFVFRHLRGLIPLWPAIIVSALGFMGHHIVVLNEFFNELPWLGLLFSAAVAVGGAFWAWLYDRTGSLFGPWLSHLLIDAGIFWIGYELLREVLAGAG